MRKLSEMKDTSSNVVKWARKYRDGCCDSEIVNTINTDIDDFIIYHEISRIENERLRGLLTEALDGWDECFDFPTGRSEKIRKQEGLE